MKRYIACLSLIAPMLAQAHWDSAYYHDSESPKTTVSTQWMKGLLDTESIYDVSIPGTHDSASRYGGWYVQTQTLDIPQQLKAGIRFLDIRLRSIGGSLAVHHGEVYQNMMFGDVLGQVKKFLQDNPSEFVMMRVKEDYGSDPKFADVVNTYMKAPQFTSYIWRGVSKPTVGEVRGKIFILKDYDDPAPVATWGPNGESIPLPRVGLYYSDLDIQDESTVSTNWDLYSKWEKVRAQLDRAQSGKRQGILNWLSGSDIAFPYFVASGHSSPGTSAPRLATGLTTPGWSWKWKDFPRVNCLGSLCTIAFEGTNTLAKDYINKMSVRNGGTFSLNLKHLGSENCVASAPPNNAYVGIIAADFPGPGLIEAVVDRNKFYQYRACKEGDTAIDEIPEVSAIVGSRKNADASTSASTIRVSSSASAPASASVSSAPQTGASFNAVGASPNVSKSSSSGMGGAVGVSAGPAPR